MIRRRPLLGVVLVATALSLVLTTSASAALFFLFAPRAAAPGDVVTARLGGTPPGFRLADRQRPLRRPMRLYLVRNDVAHVVRARNDPRLHFVGLIVPDRNGRGLLTFRAPPLDTGAYAAAAWCPGCARTSAGETFFVLDVTAFTEKRLPAMLLRLRMPDPETSCPVTIGRGSGTYTYGNGLLASDVPRDGVVRAVRREPEGVLFWKPGWLPVRGTGGFELAVRGDRLDGPGELRVLGVNWGGGSWRTAMTFSSEGCWRITGRLGDVALSYVVQVVAAS